MTKLGKGQMLSATLARHSSLVQTVQTLARGVNGWRTMPTRRNVLSWQKKKRKEAGDPFARVEQYSGAARAYREGEHFDEMMEVLRRHI